jgi:hypothetical protein
MKSRILSALLLLLPFPVTLPAQEADAPIRVTTATLNDGSREVTKIDPSTHTAERETQTPNGKLKQKIVYQLNDEGRWVTGVVYNAKGEVIMRATYKYDAGGRLSEEKQFTKDGQFVVKLVYRFNPAGRPVAVDAFDANDNPIRNKSAPTPVPVKPKRR